MTDPAAFQALADLVVRSGYHKFARMYASAPIDAGLSRLTVADRGLQRQVVINGTPSDAPSALFEIMAAVDSTAATITWSKED